MGTVPKAKACKECGREPAESFRLWKRGAAAPCLACLDAVRARLKLTSKRRSISQNAKKIENEVSRYLFGRLRDWKDRHDISGGGYRGEVKQYDYDTIMGAGGVIGVLTKALEQCRAVCEDCIPFSVLHVKHTRIATAYVMVDGVVTDLRTFRGWLQGKDRPNLQALPNLG